jgi:hypothetical protein
MSKRPLLGPQSLQPFLEESAFAAILGNDRGRRSVFVQVISFMPGRDGQDPFMRVHDGKCSVLAYVIGEDAQRTVRDNATSASPDPTPERGCLLCIQSYQWSTKELVTRTSGDSPMELCLAIDGKVVNMGGHGMGLVQGLEELHQTTRVRQALLDIDNNMLKLRANLQKQSLETISAGQQDKDKLNGDATKPSSSRMPDPPTETVANPLVDVEAVTLGNVQELLLNQGGTQIIDRIVATAEREAQIEEESVSEASDEGGQHSAGNAATDNEPRQEAQAKKNPEHSPAAAVVPPGFAVYTETGDVAIRVTDLQEMQALMGKVLDVHEEEAGGNSQLSDEESTDEADEKDMDVDKSSEKMGGVEKPTSINRQSKESSTKGVTSNRLVVNPYRKHSQKSGVHLEAPKKDHRDPTSRVTGSSPIEILKATPPHHRSQPRGIRAMLWSGESEDEDSHETSDGETSHNKEADRISGSNKNTAVELCAVAGNEDSTAVATGAQSVEENTQIDSTDPDANPFHDRKQGKGQGIDNAIVRVSKQPGDGRQGSHDNSGKEQADDSSTSSTDIELQAIAPRDNHCSSESSTTNSIGNNGQIGGPPLGKDKGASFAGDFSRMRSIPEIIPSSPENDSFYTAREESKDGSTTAINEEMDTEEMGRIKPSSNVGSEPLNRKRGVNAQQKDVAHQTNQPGARGSLDRPRSIPRLASRPIYEGDRLRRFLAEPNIRSAREADQGARQTGGRQSTDHTAGHRNKSSNFRQQPPLDSGEIWVNSLSLSELRREISSFNTRGAASEGRASRPARSKASRSSRISREPSADRAGDNPSGRDGRPRICDKNQTLSQRQAAKHPKLAKKRMLRSPTGELVASAPTLQKTAKGRTQRFANKTTFFKFFGREGTFVGSVESYNPKTGLYLIRYEDNDEE